MRLQDVNSVDRLLACTDLSICALVSHMISLVSLDDVLSTALSQQCIQLFLFVFSFSTIRGSIEKIARFRNLSPVRV